MTDQDDRTTICIHVDADFNLDVADVFPDGVPDGWTVDDVKASMLKEHGPSRLLDEWALGDNLDVSVSVSRPNPAYTGDGTLPGVEAPLPWLSDRRVVWPTWARKRDEDRRVAT